MIDPDAAAFLARQRVGHLATASLDGRPHVVPVCFALIEATIYIAIDEKPKTTAPSQLRRVRNIVVNPRVSFVADVYDDQDWSKLGFVLIDGRARIVEPQDQAHAAAVHALRGKYAQYAAMRLEDRPVIAISIERLTTWGNTNA